MNKGAELFKIRGHNVFRVNYKDIVARLAEVFALHADSLVDTAADAISTNGGLLYLFRNHYTVALKPTGIVVVD